MGTNLYIGNLSYNTTEGELLNLFGTAGEVARCQLIMDRATNRSRGFAFVEMATQEAAERVIAEFNGKEVDGRKLVVNEARPREDRPPRRDAGGDAGGGRREGGRYGGGFNRGSRY
jgi:RNA recognition motif-containing protein